MSEVVMPNGAPTNFFVCLQGEDEEYIVRRLMLSRSAQELLTEVFAAAAEDFLEAGREEVPYDGIYRPDETEIMTIRGFQLPFDAAAAVREPAAYEPFVLEADREPGIKSIFCERPEHAGEFLFQAFQRSQFLRHRRASLVFAGETFRELETPGLSIREDIHAAYRDGVLLFRSDWWAKRMFAWQAYYVEATDDELEEFTGMGLLLVDDVEALRTHADSWVRKKMGIINRRGTLDGQTAMALRERAAAYGVELEVRGEGDNAGIVLPEEKQALKRALRFLDEDYFTGELSGDAYLSNSKREVG